MRYRLKTQRGVTLLELVMGLLLSAMMMVVVFEILMFWSNHWHKQFRKINLQQNVRVVEHTLAQALRYQAASIIYPAIGQEGSVLEFRNPGAYRTYRFYAAVPAEFPDRLTIYRYVKDDKNYSAGVNQMTEPSQVRVTQLVFYRSTDTIRVHFILEDVSTGMSEETTAVMSCLNRQ